jgi:hypothetical protein
MWKYGNAAFTGCFIELRYLLNNGYLSYYLPFVTFITLFIFSQS